MLGADFIGVDLDVFGSYIHVVTSQVICQQAMHMYVLHYTFSV